MTTVMIGVRIGKAEKKRLKEAAAMARMTLSGFIREAARIEAHSLLKTQCAECDCKNPPDGCNWIKTKEGQ